MNNELLERDYIQAIGLLKIWGRIDEMADRVDLFLDDEFLGKATLNVYVRQERSEF